MEVFIPVERARSIIFNAVTQQPAVRLPLEKTAGRTLAEDVVSKDQIPPFANAAMDGFAVRSGDFEKGSQRYG